LQADGAQAAQRSHDPAKGIPRFLSGMRKTPNLHAIERDRQSGGFAEGTFVVPVNFGIGERLDQVCDRNRNRARLDLAAHVNTAPWDASS